MRVLILAAGHPALQAGGAERAAYSLFERLRADRRIAGASFAAPMPPGNVPHGALEPSVRLVDVPGAQPFTFRSKDRGALARQLEALVCEFDPDVVHLHDFLHWSIEAPEILKGLGRACVLTLHEYALVCTHYGQLVTPGGALCQSATPEACAACFPELAAVHFRARREHLLAALSFVDAVLTPSAFALGRLTAWGVDHRRAAAIENVISPQTLAAVTMRARAPAAGAVVVGYFGQVTPFKGLEVLVRACASLVGLPGLEVRIHGENAHYRVAPFQKEIDRIAGPAMASGLLRFLGPYDNRDALALMRACHAVVVPSTWWENSPLVIREAKLAQCRVICTELGGMKEKTTVPPDFHFSRSNHEELAAILRRLAREGPHAILGVGGETLRTLREDAVAFERHIATYYRSIAREPRPYDG